MVGRLSHDDRSELLALLSSCEPRNLANLVKGTRNRKVRKVLEFYRPISRADEARIWKAQKAYIKGEDLTVTPPDDERVEDAGLQDETFVAASGSARRNSSKLQLVTA